MLARWLDSLRGSSRPCDIPQALWNDTLERFPFLAERAGAALPALRQMTRQFLDQKEFHGAQGLAVSDAMAVAIASQASLAVLHIEAPYRGLDWYQDFVGIVVHPGAVLAQRESVDEHGIVHSYREALSGEAMQDGPVTLSWQDVADSGRSAAEGYNLVIHEFTHKIDMRDGVPDGCPALPPGFMGARSPAMARNAWVQTMQAQYQDFCDQLSMAERFGGQAPWLDAYAAHSVDEFFAVASEAYFVNPANFGRDFPALLAMFDAFFRPGPVSG